MIDVNAAVVSKTFEYFALAENAREVPTTVPGCDGLTAVYITGSDSIRPGLSYIT